MIKKGEQNLEISLNKELLLFTGFLPSKSLLKFQ